MKNRNVSKKNNMIDANINKAKSFLISNFSDNSQIVNYNMFNFTTDEIKGISYEDLDYHINKKSNKNTAPGFDLVTYKMIKEWPKEFKNAPLGLYNSIIKGGAIPEQWQCIKLKCILKPINEIGSYRPISLYSCLIKIFMDIVKERIESTISDLIWLHLKLLVLPRVYQPLML
jgi:hypothetical protein